MVCAECGHENRQGARFCDGCGAPLAVRETGRREERRVVTVAFCDLVNFTARSEVLDPEDVRAFLLPYYDVLTTEIARHGGTIDKFMGDGVMAVFGAPTSFEDDPERAVRMALRVLERLPELELDLHARIGVNTGEVLVVIDEAGRGDAVTGDAVNTAARLQTVAPVDGVVVGERTWAATASIFDYQELAPATLKGKARPVRVFQATAPRARFGTDLMRPHASPFVGREVDLAILKGIFEKSVAANSVQLVSVIGEPGLGKSRILAELFGYTDERPELVTWRQGRCLPYGEGITFWALGEIVKAHAGILESDDPATATAKLDVVLPDGAERTWFRQRLLPLLGIEASSVAEREELFTAWRRWLEMIAATGPTVLVFEDLHWANDALLSFLEHLADRAAGVPLLVVGTARPELYERHPAYAAGARNANRINLAPLSEEETARLISALLDTSVIPAELQRPIVDRSGGNPLYAEEFVRLLRDNDLLVRKGSGWELREGAEVPFPDSVRALIAARLDMLTPGAKSILADAAVIGKVFWAGAVAAMGDRDAAEVTDMLRELSRKELVRPARRSSMQGEAEYSFWHILTRDVAYAQLPRASRASRHVAAAAWIEAQAPERVEDLADVLASHYVTALDLAHTTGQPDQVATLQEPARRFLALSGERALGLDTSAALTNLERALALTPPGHPGRAEVLVHFARAAYQAARTGEARAALEEAIPILRQRGDLAAQARAMNRLSLVFSRLGDSRWRELPAEALALLEPLPPGPPLVEAVTEVAAAEAIQGQFDAAVDSAQRALTLAAELGLERSPRALGFRGFARTLRGDVGGFDDMREAIALATQAGQGHDVATLHNNISVNLAVFEGPQAALDELRTGIAFARSRGLTGIADFMTSATLGQLFDIGQLDEALSLAHTLAARLDHDAPGTLQEVRAVEARIHALRGQAIEAADWLAWLETTSRDAGDAGSLVDGLGSAALVYAALGDAGHASSLLIEIGEDRARETPGYAAHLPALVRTAVAIGEPDIAHHLTAGYQPHTPQAHHAVVASTATLAEADGDLNAAADGYGVAVTRWRDFGVTTEHAHALLGHGRCLVHLGQPADATSVLRQARELLQGLGASPAVIEADALLADATALSS